MPNRIGFPSIGISVEHDALLLAIDDSLLPLKKNLCFYLSKPDVRPEPVMVPSRDNPLAPDYLASHFYGTVLLEDGKYRMWYYSVAHGEAEGDLSQGPVCYAESDDGLTWVKPSLGQVTIRGSSDNNAIALTDERIEGVTLIRDDADPDPQRRYKMIYNYWQEDGAGHYFTIRTAISADGITWQPGPPSPIDEFSEQASFYAYDGLYIVNGQSGSAPQRSEGGAPRGRHGFAWISPDFNDWLAEFGRVVYAARARGARKSAASPKNTTRYTSAPARRASATCWSACTASGTTSTRPTTGSASAKSQVTSAWSSATTACAFASRSRDTSTSAHSNRR